jgi:hypothetical protein
MDRVESAASGLPSILVNFVNAMVFVLNMIVFDSYVGYILGIGMLYLTLVLIRKFFLPQRVVVKKKKEQ